MSTTINITIKHVVRNPYVNRHNRMGGGLITIYPAPGDPADSNVFQKLAGQPYRLSAPFQTQPTVDNRFDNGGLAITFGFAFWIITGLENTPIFISDSEPLIQLKNIDVMATAYYGAYDGGPGDPGIYLDAFYIDGNVFLDDDFVTVTPSSANPPNNLEVPPSDAANDGLIDTAIFPQNVNSCKIKAFGQIHGGLVFDSWLVPPSLLKVQPVNVDPASSDTLDVGRGSEAWAFALYKNPSPQQPPAYCKGYLQQIYAAVAALNKATDEYNLSFNLYPHGDPNLKNNMDVKQNIVTELINAYPKECGPLPPLNKGGTHNPHQH